MWVLRVLGDDHYKRMPSVTISGARKRTLTAQWPWVLTIGQNLQGFTDNGDISISVKNSRVGWKTNIHVHWSKEHISYTINRAYNLHDNQKLIQFSHWSKKHTAHTLITIKSIHFAWWAKEYIYCGTLYPTNKGAYNLHHDKKSLHFRA